MLPHRVKAGALGSSCKPSLGAEDVEPEARSPPQGPTEEGSTSRLVVLEGITLFRASLDNVSLLSGPRGISQDFLQGGGTSPGLSRRPPPLSMCRLLSPHGRQRVLPSRRAGAGRGQGGVPGDEVSDEKFLTQGHQLLKAD